MNTVYEKVIHCYNDIREKTDFIPRVGVVLGSGLGDFANRLCNVVTLDYKEIDGFPVSTVPGHKGRFVFGYVGKTPVMVMQGRVHYYEGYDICSTANKIDEAYGSGDGFFNQCSRRTEFEFQSG